MSIKSRSWGEIAGFYRGLVEQHGWDMQPMLRLVEDIAASRYARGAYAATSHATLCLALHPEFEMYQNTLRIDFEQGRFIFSYSESPYLKAWKKECDRAEAFSTFEHVMRRLKWFLN